MMMKFWLAPVLALPMLVGGVTHARAASVIYDINQISTGGGNLSSSPSFGTVTMTDVTGGIYTTVDITVALNNTAWKLQDFLFNFDATEFGSTTTANWTITSTPGAFLHSYNVASNAAQNGNPGGFTGNFDIQLDPNNNANTTPVTFHIGYNAGNVDVTDFEFKDTTGQLYNFAHIGNCGSSTCSATSGTGNASIWVGSGDGSNIGGGGSNVGGGNQDVPEPASLLLLASGLVGTALLRRRRIE